MENGNQNDKRTFKQIKEDLDKTHDSPEILGGKVWLVLKDHNFTSWDLVCFCLVYLMKITTVYEFLKPHAKSLHMTVYLAHYKATEELGLKPRE